MPILGNLEDISIIDVLQLLCVARKSGLLTVDGPTGPASIVLRDGAITGAHHPAPGMHVGAILTEMGLVAASEIDKALKQCASSGKPIVTTLVQMGCITPTQGWNALAQLVERTVATMVGWSSGRFAFDQHEDEISDDFRYVPAVVEDTFGGIDMQQVLMEVLRVVDERNRTDTPATATAPADKPPAAVAPAGVSAPRAAVPPPLDAPDNTDRIVGPPHFGSEDAAPSAAGEPAAHGSDTPAAASDLDGLDAAVSLDVIPASNGREPRQAAPRLAIVYSEDGFLRHLVAPACERHRIRVDVPATEHHLIMQIERCLDEPHAPPLVIDVTSQREGDLVSKKQLLLAERIKRRYPVVPLIVLGPQSRDTYLRAFELGARSYLPRVRGGSPDESSARIRSAIRLIVGCVEGYFAERDALYDNLAAARKEMTLLRQRVLRMLEPAASVDVSLILLEHVADYLERCVIFVVRRTDLLGIGAFGLGNQSETMNTVISGLKIPLDSPSLARKVIDERTVYRGTVQDEVLQRYLFAKIGSSASNEGLLLPLLGPERPIALIYADHGSKEPRRFATDALEVLASFAGLALQRKTRLTPLAQ